MKKLVKVLSQRTTITIIVMIILAAAIILSLNNTGIINKANQAVEEMDLAQVKHLATLKWSEGYLDKGLRKQSELENYVRGELGKEYINVDDYIITVTDSGVNVEMKILKEWRENVVDRVDGVPIPKGFVTSPYTGEKTKNDGLVIYELNEGENSIPSDETYQISLTTRNQYVWVPVDNFSDFVRGSYDNTTYYNVLGTDYWEIVLNTTNMPELSQDSNYVTNITLEGGITNTLAEVQAMYESVKEYKGFYIACYEAGLDTENSDKVYSMMGKTPRTRISWGESMSNDTNGAVQIARTMYPVTNANYGIVSTLIYGVQWDRTLAWWQELNSKFSVVNSIDYGNYLNHEIESANDLNEGAQVAVFQTNGWYLGPYVSKDAETLTYPKSSTSGWMLSTGALKAAKVNNIYDMAGNMLEWTMEGNSTSGRVRRGGYYMVQADSNSVSSRSAATPTSGDDNTCQYGFRVALYIKNNYSIIQNTLQFLLPKITNKTIDLYEN